MKIAIPVDEKNMETKVCISFGRAPYFLIYDTETKESLFLDNSAAASAGGAGIKAAQSIIDQKVDIVLSLGCGENAANVLNAANVKIFKAIYNLAKDNIDAFIDNKLSLLNEIHAGFHNHGGK